MWQGVDFFVLILFKVFGLLESVGVCFSQTQEFSTIISSIIIEAFPLSCNWSD